MAKKDTVITKSKEKVSTVPATEIKNPEKTEQKTEKNAQLPPKKKTGFRTFFFRLLVLFLAAAALFLYFDRQKTLKNQDILASKLTADYTNKYNELTRRLQQQEKEISALKNAKPVSESTLSKTDYDRLRSELLSELDAHIAAAAPSENTAPSGSTVSEPAAEAVSLPVQPQNSVSNEVLLASGAMIVRGLADSSQSFVYETEVLQILAQGNEPALRYVDIIRKYAASGIRNPSALIRTFNKIYADLSRPQPMPEIAPEKPENFIDSLKGHFQSFVSVKKRQPKPVTVLPKNPDTVHELVNTGRFAEALNEISTDRKYRYIATKELSVWMSQTQEYLEFERAVNGLIMNALANIRLKEFNHNAAE